MTGRHRAPLLFVAAILLAGPLRAQGADDLYDAGAFRLAADSFAARAAKAPDVPAHWYNLGNALYREGDDVGARGAWLRAARLSPRDHLIQQALRLVPPPDATSAAASDAAIVTPGEFVWLGAVLWVASWMLLAFHRRARIVISVMVMGVAALVLGSVKEWQYHQPVAMVRRANTSLRAAPYASATSGRAMGEGTTVEVLQAYAGWRLVRRANDRGWVQGSELVTLGPMR